MYTHTINAFSQAPLNHSGHITLLVKLPYSNTSKPLFLILHIWIYHCIPVPYVSGSQTLWGKRGVIAPGLYLSLLVVHKRTSNSCLWQKWVFDFLFLLFFSMYLLMPLTHAYQKMTCNICLTL